MIFTQFAAQARDKLRARTKDLADFVVGGNAKSFEHYKDLCGEIRGLAHAERDLLDAAEQLEEAEFK